MDGSPISCSTKSTLGLNSKSTINTKDKNSEPFEENLALKLFFCGYSLFKLFIVFNVKCFLFSVKLIIVFYQVIKCNMMF